VKLRTNLVQFLGRHQSDGQNFPVKCIHQNHFISS
jgi:hypothetical protein